MLTGAVFAYGVLASFILSSLERNRREHRTRHGTLTTIGWGLMSASFAMAALLLMLVLQLASLS